MVANTDALEVLNNMPHPQSCVKGNHLTQLGIQRLIQCVDDEASFLSLRRLECVPVGDAGAMCGFRLGADHTGRAVGDQLVLYCRVVWTWKPCTETIGVVGLVHYEADEIVFPPFLVKMDRIEELC